MATITLIGEALPGFEATLHTAAARDLTEALAQVAPRGCSARLLVAHDRESPVFVSARARTEALPLRANLLPWLWRTGAAARPLDGEFVHALTPLVPLRVNREENATQTTVTVPHALAWEAPELLGNSDAKHYRAFVKRAIRLADAVLTPTHATAQVLFEHFGDDAPVQVMPLAAPRDFGMPMDAAAAATRRSELELPARYIVTTAAAVATATQPEAPAGSTTPAPAAAVSNDRFEWLQEAWRSDGALPDLVVLSEAPHAANIRETLPEALRSRVHIVQPSELSDWGVVLSGAALLALPQQHLGTGYEVLGALQAGVPVIHGGSAVAAELTLDAGIAAPDAASFADALHRLFNGDSSDELTQLRILAEDRGHSFTWATTAWHLWELHAGL